MCAQSNYPNGCLNLSLLSQRFYNLKAIKINPLQAAAKGAESTVVQAVQRPKSFHCCQVASFSWLFPGRPLTEGRRRVGLYFENCPLESIGNTGCDYSPSGDYKAAASSSISRRVRQKSAAAAAAMGEQRTHHRKSTELGGFRRVEFGIDCGLQNRGSKSKNSGIR